MNILGINSNFSALLKRKYSYSLGVFPFSLMLSCIGVLYLAIGKYRQYYGYSQEVSLKELPIFEYAFVILVVMLVLSYIVGWLFNAIIARMVFGWSNEKLIGVFLHSNVPNEWYKNNSETFEKAQLTNLRNWKVVRNKGKFYFILKFSIVGFFIMSMISLFLGFDNRNGEEINWLYSITVSVLVACVSALVAGFIWTSTETEYKSNFED